MTFTERQQVIAFTERLQEFTDRFYQDLRPLPYGRGA